MPQSVYFAATGDEAGRHIAPLNIAPLNVEVAEPDAILRRAVAGDLVVFFSEHFERFRDACQQLKNRNVATLYMIDGILEWRNAWENRADEPACQWTMRPVLAHKVACIGTSQARVLAAWGNESKIEVTGVPRFDTLVNRWTADRGTDAQPVDTFRILIMTAKFPGFTSRQTENARCGLADLKAFFESDPKHGQDENRAIEINRRPIEVVWRLTRSMHERVGVQNQLHDLSGNELAAVLDSVDAVISTPSTAMVEAMLMRRPVAMLEYNRNPHYVPAAWHIGSQQDIAGVIEQLIDPPASKIQYQNSILIDTLMIAEQESASERMSELIRRMLATAADQLRTKQALDFPARILDPVAPFGGAFNHHEIYTGYAGFDTSDTTELQSREAHSRRQITYLQSEIARLESMITSLESQLGDATTFIDNIHNHPVAGPVIRTREKLIDWASRIKQQRDAGPDERR